MTKVPYKSAAQVAKIVRAILKENWPEVKFSVRSETYASGASIQVRWTDGPKRKDVDAKIGIYADIRGYDITDLAEYRGVMTHKGERFYSLADHIFTIRKLSVSYLRQVAEIIAPRYGQPVPAIQNYELSGAWVERGDPSHQVQVDHPAVWLSDVIYYEANSVSKPEELR